MEDIQTQISVLKENDLRIKIVIPLLASLGAIPVIDLHGRNEKGKDVYFGYCDVFGDCRHACIFLKAGDINKSGVGNSDIRVVISSIEEAIDDDKFVSPINNKDLIDIEEVHVVCNGNIKSDARDLICTKIKGNNKFRNLRFIDNQQLTRHIRKILNDYVKLVDGCYVFSIDTFGEFCRKVVAYKENLNSNNPGNSTVIMGEVTLI